MTIWRKLAKDTAVLTAGAVLMRFVGMAWQVWLAGRIGPAGVGLWSLVGSVNVFTATLAISGIRFTTTRLVSEELGVGRPEGARRSVGCCLAYALFFGLAAFAVMSLTAEPVGFLWLRDARIVKSLRLLAWTLPLISLSCVLGGYFVASGRAVLSAGVQAAEQLIAFGAVALLLRRADGSDLEACCAAIARGQIIGDAASLLLLSGLYLCFRRRDLPRPSCSAEPKVVLTGRMLRIAFPLALSAYARTGLTTLENLLTPQKLRASGLSAEASLAGYGTVTGMVMPIVTFPSCLLGAVAELTVPLLTAAQVRGDSPAIRAAVKRLLRSSLLFSLACGAFLFAFAAPLGWTIYRTREVVPYLRLLSLLAPFLYCDIVIDGCLKGLGQMLWSMRLNVAEAILGVILIVTLLPRFGLRGYLAELFLCEVFNVSLSFWKLRKTVREMDHPSKLAQNSLSAAS